jgi:hypothetical protein
MSTFWPSPASVAFLPLLPSKAGGRVRSGEWLFTNVLKKMPHRQFIFSIPKILRRDFLYDRCHLFDLNRRG